MAQKIFYNGNILTQDKSKPHASAFAISNQKIVAVGSDEEILNLNTASTQTFNLKHQTILPGFNDAHIHIWKVGNLLTYMLDLRGVKSIDEMLQLLVDYSNKNQELDWIQARGFNEALFPDQRMPTKRDLDRAISDRPVAVIRTCAHQLIANSKALAVAGVNEKTPGIAGGEIKKFDNGELKGHFTESAIGLITKHIPSYSSTQYCQMIEAAQNEFLKCGITSSTDPAVTPDLLEVYHSMDKNAELKIRVNAIPIRLPDGETKPLPLPGRYSSEFLKVNAVKFFADGGLSGKTAAMKSFYKNSKERGVLRLEHNFFKQLALESQEAGFKIATHAIGDEAMDLVCKAYEEISLSNKNRIRHRIEHAGFASEKNLSLMQHLNISAVMQPVFIAELGRNFRNYLDDELLEKVYPVRNILQYKINVAFSTDAPVVKNFNPLFCIQSALERKDADGFEIGADQKISLPEALYAYTMGSAIANDDEENRGSIEKNKWADFLVLDSDLMKTSTEKISAVNVKQTFIGGELVYHATSS